MATETALSQWTPVKRARVEAAARPRGIIFNDDTHELALDEANTPEGFLAHRLTPLAGTQVATIAWSVLGGQFDSPVYDSHIQPIYGDAHGGELTYWRQATANVKALIEQGACPLQLVIDFSHANGMETFASVRMNDVHDSFMDAEGMTLWKRTHPEFMVDTTGMLPEFELYTTAQDFSHEPVRRRKLEIIEEIAHRYDVDGFELDFIRHPVLFSRRLRGETCTAEECETITGFMRQIRRITDAAAAQRGRPILVAPRVPDSFERALECGMDLAAWLEQDLVDILIAGGGYVPFSLPVAEFAEAAEPQGVPVYPCVNQSMADTVSDGAFLEGVRGLASNWYAAGARGLYFWNLGTPFEFRTGEDLEHKRAQCYACLAEVGDPETIRGREKVFAADNQASVVFPYYRHASSRPPLPITSKAGPLRTGVIGRVPLVVGDDLEAHPLSRATLTMSLDDASWRELLLVRLNGHELEDGECLSGGDGEPGCRMSYPVSAPPLRSGRNYVEVAARSGEIPERVVTIGAIKLVVSYD